MNEAKPGVRKTSLLSTQLGKYMGDILNTRQQFIRPGVRIVSPVQKYSKDFQMINKFKDIKATNFSFQDYIWRTFLYTFGGFWKSQIVQKQA